MTTQTATSNISPLISNNLSIVSLRQRRLVFALYMHGRLGALQLREIVGAINIPEVVSQLRARGWDLPCDLVEVVDRDGQITRPGEYFLTGADSFESADFSAE